MLKNVMVCLLLVLLATPALMAGYITPDLADKMQGLAASEKLQIVVMLSQQADISSLDRQLKLERATLADRNRRVIEALQEVANATQPAVADFLEQLRINGDVEKYQMLWIANMFIAIANNTAINAIASRSDIGDLYWAYPIELIAPVETKSADPDLITTHEIGLERINAPAAWALGYTGAGRVVSNMDTGVAGTHPALAARFRGDVNGNGTFEESWYDPYANSPNPMDSNGHGTHTMGTICGRTPSGDTIGVAIDAQWIASAPIDRGGGISRTIADAILSFQWTTNPDGDPNTQDNPDAVGNSWGIPQSYAHQCDTTFWRVIDNCEAAGTVVVFSAGNESTQGLRSPAARATTLYNCFSVGAVDGSNPQLPLASFSSRGPSLCASGNLAIKPEVVAPGVNVRSAAPSGGYQTMSGTSMASPHVTGSVAVIRQVNPNLDVDAIKEILMSTARDLPFSSPNGEDNLYGHGIIDLYEACLVAQSGYGYVTGYVRDLQQRPIAGASVSVVNSPRRVTTNANGAYFMGLPADTTYNLVAEYFGHVPDSATVTITEDDTVMENFVLTPAPYGFVDGYVKETDSTPIAGAQLTVVGTPLDPVTTNSNGYYIFTNIPGGSNYTIQASAAGHGSGRTTLFVPVNDTVSADFYLQELESFEVNNGGWVGTGGWEWGAPSAGPGQAYDGSNVWADRLAGSYSNNADDTLYTTTFSITDSNATFTFYHWYNFENSYDGGNLAISVDGGATWQVLDPDGGYPDDQITGLEQEPGYTNASNGWLQAVFQVGAYVGQTVKFRFRFGTDGSVTRDGWFIDGVVLNGGINWGALEPSLTGINPTSFNVVLDSGSTVTRPLVLTNGGPGLLNYSAYVLTDGRLRGNPISYPDDENTNDIVKHEVGDLTYYDYAGEKADRNYSFDDGSITDFGGPDGFGYRWIDSNEPQGPDYSWIDITTRGNPIPGLGDDTNVGPFDIGFNFPFYGNEFSTFRFCTNGWISFTSTVTTYSNRVLPSTPEPYNLIAPFWDDLTFATAGTAYYLSTGDSLIVSWHDVPHFGTGGPYTFQIILLASGKIVFQYQTVNSPVNSSTTGIQNSNGSVGLQVAFNQDYLTNELAVEIRYPVFWLTIDPRAGAIFPNESGTINVTFDASELPVGMYTGSIQIITNDPDHQSVSVPCTLQVVRTDIAENDGALPAVFSLAQNYPNPFNPTTEISFGLPTAGPVKLEIFDIVGRKVKTLVNREMAAGVHKVIWDGRNEEGGSVGSGIYFYRLSSGDNSIARKMVMLK